MINVNQARKYCGEDISLIENYEQAIADTTQTWECHHRLGIYYQIFELKAFGMYLNRPAGELIFLTKSEHDSLHNKNKILSAEAIANISASLTGVPKSAEARANMSKAKKGNKNGIGNKGSTGLIHVNNGIRNYYWPKDEPLPYGLFAGRLYYKRSA